MTFLAMLRPTASRVVPSDTITGPNRWVFCLRTTEPTRNPMLVSRWFIT